MTPILNIFLQILIVAVVFVNGWTDAPNAITCCVSTGVLSYRKAVRLAAYCNLAGILVMSFVNTSVADTISSIARLDPSRPDASIAALCAAMLAIVLFSVAAWYFGIPTSESHALIAGLSGAAIAVGDTNVISPTAWSKVIAGLILSLLLGFGLGYLVTRLLGRLFGNGYCSNLVQIVSAGSMAFMHGAQDGQKFIAVFIMARALSTGTTPDWSVNNLPLILLTAGTMALGTLFGGKRIIAKVGGKMVALEKYQGACADIGGSLCLLLASMFGIPMSTTHTKTTAMIGAGYAASQKKVDLRIVREMLIAWIITFPVCGLLGYLFACWLMAI